MNIKIHIISLITFCLSINCYGQVYTREILKTLHEIETARYQSTSDELIKIDKLETILYYHGFAKYLSLDDNEYSSFYKEYNRLRRTPKLAQYKTMLAFLEYQALKRANSPKATSVNIYRVENSGFFKNIAFLYKELAEEESCKKNNRRSLNINSIYIYIIMPIMLLHANLILKTMP